MASFFDEIAKNKLKSMLLMLIFIAFFSGIVYLFVYFLGGGIFAFIVGFAIILVYAAFVYFSGDKMTLKMSGAKPADKSQYQSLYSIIDGLASATQVPMPKVYIVNDPNPNAFATGRNRKVSAVAVTTGLLSTMNKRELEGVLAHEMSHIADNDVQFMMIAIIFVGVIGILAAIIRSMFWFGGIGGNRQNNSGVLIIIALVMSIIAPIFAILVNLAISRRREYMADANGARITRDPQGLAGALLKIKNYAAGPNAQPVKAANEVNGSMYFANPFKGKSLMNIFSTHPPIDERIKRLEKMY
ncbi:MAG: M48 family metalloprotease [Candidatus Marsarchaeota archaeon]|nr:M48 family metalloprotease [Candidatus Marsarchaeota archaeon]